MPLHKGFSKAVVSTNIAEMMNSGRSQSSAVAASLRSARESYRSRHPRGPFPKHLQTSETYRATRSNRNRVTRDVHYFEKGSLYSTSYGTAIVKSVNSAGTALFKIRRVSPEAARMGYEKGSTFHAHPDDETVPSPREWTHISGGSLNRTGPKKSVCRCDAYSFPHAPGSGACSANRVGGTRGGRARKYYVVDQVRVGQWEQVGHFHLKADAVRFAREVGGRTRILRTYPSFDRPPMLSDAERIGYDPSNIPPEAYGPPASSYMRR